MHLSQFWHPNTRLLRSVLNPNTCASFGQFWLQILASSVSSYSKYTPSLVTSDSKNSPTSVSSDIQIPTFFGQFWFQILAFFGQFWLQIRTSSGQFWHPHIIRLPSVSSNIKSLKLHRLSLELFDLVFFAQPPKHNTTTLWPNWAKVAEYLHDRSWMGVKGPQSFPEGLNLARTPSNFLGGRPTLTATGPQPQSGNSRFFGGRPSLKVTGL